MSAPGSIAAQIGLLFMLERYERAERLVSWFPRLPELGREADLRHQHLFAAALQCGFDPAWKHGHLSCLEWSRRRAETIRRVLPTHTADAEQRAA
jgi:hypothetical protein